MIALGCGYLKGYEMFMSRIPFISSDLLFPLLSNLEIQIREELMKYSYESKEALGKHGGSKEFKAFNKKLQDEGLIASPMQLKFLKNAGGFGSRL